MTAILPDILYRTRRGLCPCCGAPLRLDANNPQVDCGYCGRTAMLERRLRKAEPALADAPLRLYRDIDIAEAHRAAHTPWQQSAPSTNAQVLSANCPGCGGEIHYQDDAAIVACPSCGTDCRVERRLWSALPDPATEIARPRHPSERPTDDDSTNPETEHLVYRILHELDADRRLVLARKFEAWTYINGTAARFLPPLLAATRGAEPAFAHAISDLIGKLLCEGEQSLRNSAIRAAERFIFDVGCSRAIIFEVGLGDGVCLKPLLDAAEFAVRRGDLEYACACLWGVDCIFQRNFPHHEIMGQIILYRMLYLSGPVLAFALLLAQRQVTGTGFYYPAETLLAFMDDAAIERPSLLPELDKSFYVGWPKDDAEFKRRFEVFGTLKSDAARTSAVKHYLRLPEHSTDEQWNRYLAFMLPLNESPVLQAAADESIAQAIHHVSPTPLPVHELVKERGRSLPVEVQRAYLSQNEETPYLSYKDLPYRTPPKEPQLSAEMKLALAQWKDGMSKAVEAQHAIREEARSRVIADVARTTDIFDGKNDGPPPAPKPAAIPVTRPTKTSDESYEAAAAERNSGENHNARQRSADADAAILASYREVIAQLEALRAQFAGMGPETLKTIDDQIAGIRRQFPRLR